MIRISTTLTAAAFLAAALSLPATDAKAQNNGAVAAGVVGGLVAGAVIGGAIASSRPAPTYYAPQPVYGGGGYGRRYNSGYAPVGVYGGQGAYRARAAGNCARVGGEPIFNTRGQIIGQTRGRLVCG